MDQKNQNFFIDLVTQAKHFYSYKVISSGKFSASIEVDYQDKGKKRAVLMMQKEELEYKEFDWQKLKSPYVVQAINHEYLPKLHTYVFYTESGESTLEDKISDKNFRKSVGAIESIFKWIKESSMGIKHLQKNSYVHLNICTKSIIITHENTAKVGCLDYCRSSYLEIKSDASGLKSHLRPPESFARDPSSIDGMKYDNWCLAVMTLEAVTNNYLARRNKQVSSWSEVYPAIHKVLQAKKFQKVVKEAYSKAAKKANLNKILGFLKHTLKLQPADRPDAGEIFLLLFELQFHKDINAKLTDEKIWKEKAPLEDLEREIQCMSFEKKSSYADKKKTIYSGIRFEDENIRDDTSAKMLYAEVPPNEGTMGDFKQDELKDKSNGTDALTFEHRGLNISESSSPRTVSYESLKSENDQAAGPDQCRKDKEKFRDNIDGEINPKEKHYDSPDTYCDDKHTDKEMNSKGKSFDSNDTYCTEKHTDEEINLKKKSFDSNDTYCDEKYTDEKINPKEQNYDSNGTYCAKKQNCVITSKSEKRIDENDKENATRNNITAKGIICKFVTWALEEKFYYGIMHNDSFINKLSKSLTG